MAKQKEQTKSAVTNGENNGPLRKLFISGFPNDATLTQIQSFLPSWLVIDRKTKLLYLTRNKRTSSIILKSETEPLTNQYNALCTFLKDSRFNGEHIITVEPYKEPKSGKGKRNKKKSKIEAFAKDFWKFITIDKETSICARDHVSIFYREFCSIREDSSFPNFPRQAKSKEISTITKMRHLKLVKSVRADNYSVMVIFRNPVDLNYPSPEEQTSAKQKLKSDFNDAKSNKNGVVVAELPDRITGTIGETEFIRFHVEVSDSKQLTGVQIKGAHAHKFSTSTALPVVLDESNRTASIELTVVPQRIGLIRAWVYFVFEDFVIARAITISCGNAEMLRLLQPTSHYKRKKKKYIINPKKKYTFDPPKQIGTSSKAENPFQTLPQYLIPSEIHESLRNDNYDSDMDQTGWTVASAHDSVEGYGNYWKHLLWAEEHQINRDIQMYDMEKVQLRREGMYYLLTVPGLAEGRPSVLRGDIVHITFRSSLYKGRVMFIRQLEVVLLLHVKFAQNYNPAIDRVSVRFTFSRMTLRTSHRACESLAEKRMGAHMLVPSNEHVVARDRILREISSTNEKLAPWANRNLNPEQQAAVQRIANSLYRPLPYIIFGPPGTGKTTTVVETIYQLGKKLKMKILLVAPSNDAADILVERLSDYFVPTELRRILAYSRSIDTLPTSIRAYATDSLDHTEQATEIRNAQIVVSTVNLAARFSFWGIPRGHFEVLCVDEAGHATEPEVIAVASSLINFDEHRGPLGRFILAGDPKQLGPVSSSDVCLKYGLSVSYMERLTDRSIYQPRGEDSTYPQDLLTKLIRNYRSHPAILKLPNDMFYKDDLQCCGDAMTLNNMARWEHLPKQRFPVLFHAMEGENLREGQSPSWFNPEEAQQAVEYARLLIEESRPSLEAEEIGIITPYARQAQKIRMALKTQNNMDDIKVGSVESFQGQERRVIIISTVRTEREQVQSDIRYNLGFVANPKRFNVAITRAKALLIVIGSPSMLALDKDNWLPFLKYCHENGAWTGDDWDPSKVLADDQDGDDDMPLVSDDSSKSSLSSSGADDFVSVDGPSQVAQQEEFVVIQREE